LARSLRRKTKIAVLSRRRTESFVADVQGFFNSVADNAVPNAKFAVQIMGVCKLSREKSYSE